ncbi:hypothetical protein M0805_003227 [Coniferiporia weirii]|nr:hypothetical protein M0805_003227 [Coniferiporia weirii]
MNPLDLLDVPLDLFGKSDVGISEALSSAASPVLVVLAGVFLAWSTRRAFNRLRVKSLIRSLPGPSNPSWFSGNFPEIYDVLNIRWHHEAVKTFAGIFQINGMFGDEQLYITDSRAMYHILVKEQTIFEEPQSLLVMNRALLGDGLLSTIGGYHRKQRKVLNPFFSEKHMRGLAPIFGPITQKVCKAIESKLSGGPAVQEINMYEWTSRTALEFIAQGGLGTSLDTLVDGEMGDYTKLVKEMVPTVSRLHVPMQLLPLVQPLFSLLPGRMRGLLLAYSPSPAVRNLKGITDRLEATGRGVLEQKRSEVLAELSVARANEEGSKARDILSLLLHAQNHAPADERLPDAEVIGHIITLIFAAQDTTSSALTRILHLLASRPAAQARLRTEIRQAQCSEETASVSAKEEWDYDALMHLPYLDAVVRETLRLHSPVSWIWRVARQPTTLPLRRPLQGTDGSTINSVPIARNQGVILGIAAAHRDEGVWGRDAHEWRPERWLNADADLGTGESKTAGGVLGDEARYPGVYSGMMTFSGGGRSCIGFKFALLALKLELAGLVDHFEFAEPEAEIVWNMNHIAAPTVKGREEEGAQMPLKVTLAHGGLHT